MKKAIKNTLLLAVLFVVGVSFRLWIAHLVPQPFINDQRDYEWYAIKILRDPHMIAAHSFRSYPMGLLTAVVYRIFGYRNNAAIIPVQAVMDSVVILMIFFVLRRGMGFRGGAWIGAILYAINPFTAGYVNVLLAEILTVFCIVASTLTGVLFLRRPRVLWGILFGISLGITAEARNAAFLWTAIPLGLLIVTIPIRKAKKAYAAIGVGLVLTILYPLYANWRDFRAINITTVDSFYAKEFFNGAIIKRLPPLAPPLPEETYTMYAEYYTEYNPERQNAAYRSAMAQKYYKKAWDIIVSDPLDYIRVRLDKMWYVWQKEAIYVYTEPGFERDKEYTYVLNLILLSLAFTGLLVWPTFVVSRLAGIQQWIHRMIIGTVLYGTVVFSFTHAEQRLTIPFYPLLVISATVGVMWIVRSTKQLFSITGKQR